MQNAPYVKPCQLRCWLVWAADVAMQLAPALLVLLQLQVFAWAVEAHLLVWAQPLLLYVLREMCGLAQLDVLLAVCFQQLLQSVRAVMSDAAQ